MIPQRQVSQATLKPCAQCPWRTANQGRRHPGGWYTKANLRRLWAGLRRGVDMTCHPTDPDNEVTDEMVAQGVKRPPETARTNECAGALVLKQREFMRYQALVDAYPDETPAQIMRRYRQAHPRGLTRDGLVQVLSRAMFDGTPMGARLPMAKPNLNQQGIGHPDLVPWTPGEGNRLADETSQRGAL